MSLHYIANPMYDTVFKYLLEDPTAAKLLIGTILQEEILSLTFRPQERTSAIDGRGARVLTVYRVDFAARVRNRAGLERQVLIELQKAKYPADIMRFRRYLGAQYRDPDNTCTVELTGGAGTAARTVRQGLPLLTIYFLGHALEHSTAPVIQIRRDCIDLRTGTALPKREPFIESLTHDSYVIQIPKLGPPHRTELETMLQLFDQGRACGDRHRLAIEDGALPARYRPLLRRLERAAAEPQVADAMELEDEVLEELQDIERALERERAAAERERAATEHERAEKERERAEKERERAEKERERAEKEQALAEQERLRALLRAAGLDPERAAMPVTDGETERKV